MVAAVGDTMTIGEVNVRQIIHSAMGRSRRLAHVSAVFCIAVTLLAVSAPVVAEGEVTPLGALIPATGHVRPTPGVPYACQDGIQGSGAKYRICMPLVWNRELVVYAHGYMAPNQDVHIPEDQLQLGGLYVPDVVNFMGYAFATTSYSANGLAVGEGLADLVDLVRIFRSQHPQVTKVYLVGVSEGGLITALATERYPDVFDGGLALCGPVGDFSAQADYFGDFRTVFDYFFPQILPSSPISIPQSLMDDWHRYYADNVLPAIADSANAISVTQLMSVTQAAYDPNNVQLSMGATISGVLWYNVFATNDAMIKLHGQPYDNAGRVYSGSLDDARLNGQVQRFSAEAAALNELEAKYQTTGRPQAPLVTLHNTLDPIVPNWHEDLYRDKVEVQHRKAMHNNLPPAARYGHCNFTLWEVQQALQALQAMVANPVIPPWSVAISGPPAGKADISQPFVATVSPLSATKPITYTWAPEPDSGQGTANATYAWATEGRKAISVTVENAGGMATGSRVIIITSHMLYLPMVTKGYRPTAGR